MKRLLVIGAEGHFGREILKGIDAYCTRNGNWEFHLEEGILPDTIKRAGLAIRQWKADAIIARVLTAALERLVRRSGLPVVNVSGVREIDLPLVRTDDATAGRMVARHFLDSGFRSFGFSAKTGEAYTIRRCEGFVGELAGAGFGCNVFADRCEGTSESNWVRNRQRMDRWLLSLPKPVGVTCIHDFRGRDIAQACRLMGIRVPDDVAVVGMGNEEIMCRMCSPPLSSVQVDSQRIGYEAARLVDQMIHGRRVPSQLILIAPKQVVMRQSSDIVAIDDPDIASAVRFIRDHAGEPITVKDILREVPISRRAMEMRFARLVGRTPRGEITRIRMARARSLLAETKLPIPAVAQGSGFTCSASFSDFFRRTVGVTPTHYRRNSAMAGS